MTQEIIRMYTVDEVEEIRRDEYARGYKASTQNGKSEWYMSNCDGDNGWYICDDYGQLGSE